MKKKLFGLFQRFMYTFLATHHVAYGLVTMYDVAVICVFCDFI